MSRLQEDGRGVADQRRRLHARQVAAQRVCILSPCDAPQQLCAGRKRTQAHLHEQQGTRRSADAICREGMQ